MGDMATKGVAAFAIIKTHDKFPAIVHTFRKKE
jgi:hypothetical protein